MRVTQSRVKRPNSPARGITLHYLELYRNLELRRSRRRVVLGLEKKDGSNALARSISWSRNYCGSTRGTAPSILRIGGAVSGSWAAPQKPSFCGERVSSSFEIGGIGETLTIFTLSFKQPLTACWIHIKLHCHAAAFLKSRAQFVAGQN